MPRLLAIAANPSTSLEAKRFQPFQAYCVSQAGTGRARLAAFRSGVGGIDTDMLAAVEAEKADPADIARAGLDGIEAGAMEILADRNAVALKAILNADPSVLYPELAS
jgi:hypothetical protein